MATDLLDDLLSDDFLEPRRKRRRRSLLADSLDSDFLDEPTPSELRRQRSEERRALTPEEETSVLGQVGDLALSGLGWFGDVLDKYTGDRALRGLIAGKPRELLSLIPFSDDLGITDAADKTTGQDLLGWQDKDSWWDDIAGAGLEFGLGLVNPLSWISSAADAVTDAGKVAKQIGLFDNAAKVATSKAQKAAMAAGEVGRKVGGFEAQMTTTLRDLLEHTSESAPELAESYATAAASSAKQLGKKLDDVLDMPLGHRLGIAPPFGETIGALPGFEAGSEFGQAVARASDATGDFLLGEIPYTGYSPLRHLGSLFDPNVQGAGTATGQRAFDGNTRMANAAEADVDQQAIELLKAGVDAGVDEGEMRNILEGVGHVFRRPDDGSPLLPEWLHVKEFDAEARPRFAAEAQKSFPGLGSFLQGATPDQKKLAAAFFADPNADTWDDLVQSQAPGVAHIGPLTAADVMQNTEAARAAMGDWGRNFVDVIRDAAKAGKPITQEAWASAEGIQPGIYRMRKRPDLQAAGLPPELQTQVQRFWKANDDHWEALAKEGVAKPMLVDAEMNSYASRRASGLENFAEEVARDLDLKHFPGGTSALKAMLLDAGAQPNQHIDDFLRTNYRDPIEQQLQNEARMYGNPPLAGAELEAAFKERVRGIKTSLLTLPEETRKAGIFGNHPAMDFRTTLLNRTGRIASVRSANDALAEFLKPILTNKGTRRANYKPLDSKAGMTINNLWQKLGMKPGAPGDEYSAMNALARRMGIDISKSPGDFGRALDNVGSTVVPQDLANDILKAHGAFEITDSAAKLTGIYDSITQVFKSFVLTWPARYVRDLMSGQLQSAVLGNWSPKSAGMVYDLLIKGTPSEEWRNLAPVQEVLQRQGINPATATAEQATAAAKIHLSGQSRLLQGQTSEVMRTPQATPQDVLGNLVGDRPILSNIWSDATSKMEGKSWLETLFGVEGAFGQTDTINPVLRAGNSIGTVSDQFNRLIPYVEMLQQGYSPKAALERVMLQQVDYSGKATTKFESSFLAKLFPFYKFTKGMVKQLASEFWERPRGRMAAAVKAQASLARQDEGEFIPSHIRQTMALPIGREGANQTYLTGFGLMHEDPFSLLRPGANVYDTVSGFGQEVIGRMNPIPKAGLELAFGQQAYSGRDLRDLEGGLSRAVGNVLGMERGPDFGILTEEAIAASPASRAVSTIRTLFDPRKSAAQKAVNLSTGVRMETVDIEKAKNVATRKALEDLLRGKPGVAAFEHLYEIGEGELSAEDDKLMRAYRRHAFQQQQAVRAARKKAEPKKDALDELLGL